MGLVIASLDRADIRQSRYGLYVHGDEGKRDIEIAGGRENAVAQRQAELEELYAAVVGGQQLWHDGRWGMATLEVCLAIMQSAAERREIMLSHQVSVPGAYDADMPVPGEPKT
jgi:phthalate 4,5-cis-dihydrodiol dehydrogenase